MSSRLGAFGARNFFKSVKKEIQIAQSRDTKGDFQTFPLTSTSSRKVSSRILQVYESWQNTSFSGVSLGAVSSVHNENMLVSGRFFSLCTFCHKTLLVMLKGHTVRPRRAPTTRRERRRAVRRHRGSLELPLTHKAIPPTPPPLHIHGGSRTTPPTHKTKIHRKYLSFAQTDRFCKTRKHKHKHTHTHSQREREREDYYSLPAFVSFGSNTVVCHVSSRREDD